MASSAPRRSARPSSASAPAMSAPTVSATPPSARSEEHTSELPSLMRLSYDVFCLKKKKNTPTEILKKNNKKRNHKNTAETDRKDKLKCALTDIAFNTKYKQRYKNKMHHNIDKKYNKTATQS